MPKDKTHSDNRSAADKAIGFEFQYYYFLHKLLSLNPGESVGWEVLDDVHTELVNDRQILVQLKHTTQVKADGSSKNLITLDLDLWKTLSNWSQVIINVNDGRTNKTEQLKFIKKTDFLLVSNKSENEQNTLLKAVVEFQNGKSFKELLLVLAKLENQTQNETVKSYIQKVQSLDKEVSEEFFRHLSFNLGENNIIAKCKLAIKAKMVPELKVGEVFRNLDSQIREDNFITVQNKNKIIISFDGFYKRYRKLFDLARTEKLIIRPFEGILPDHFADQKFIQQLLDIEDIKPEDVESMAEFTRHRLQMENNLNDWHQNGEITSSEIDEFDRETIVRWKNNYREVYRQCENEDVPKKALELVDSLRKEKVFLASDELSTDMSNGQYYRLSDKPVIGWHKDWEKKYK